MKKWLLTLLFIPSLVFAEKPNIWERAAYGSVPGVAQVRLLGINVAIPATYETIWGESAAYAPLTVAMSAPYCASSNANDTSAGTGARTVTVTGINTSFAPFSEVVTMDGQTSVVLATANILLFNSAEVTTAGSGGLNAGQIQCGTGTNTSGDPAVTHLYLTTSSETAIPGGGTGGGNIARSFIYGVPANKTLVCRNITAGSVFVTAASALQVAIDSYTNLGILKRPFQETMYNGGSNATVWPALIKFPEKTIIIGKMAGVTGSNTGPVSLSAECLLVNATSDSTLPNMEF